VTPAFLSRCPLVLGNEDSALHRTIIDWLSAAGPMPKPVMQFDNVEAIKSVVAVGLGASIVPSVCVGAGHVTANTLVVSLKPRVSRRVGLVRMRGKQDTDAMKIVSAALLSLGAEARAGVSR
jgi:DNA-binding transcriptional LysR family regulator